MTCGTCKHPFSMMVFLRIHWVQTGCQKGRLIWERVFRSKRAGHSGRKILREAYPNLYPASRPMPPEVKEGFRAKQEAQS